jgi:tetratricopeptide (TPR) repeat protein
MSALGNAYQTLGHASQARRLLEGALERRRTALSDPHLDLASSLFSLALLEESTGHDEAAEPLHRDALRMRLSLLDPVNSDVQTSRLRLHQLLIRRRDFEGAKSLILDYVAAFRTTRSVNPSGLSAALHAAGVFLLEKGDFRESEQCLAEAIEHRARMAPDDGNRIIPRSRFILGSLHYKQGRYSQAAESFKFVNPELHELDDNSSLSDIHLANNIALTVGLSGDADRSMQLFDQVLTVKRRQLGENHHSIGHSLYDLSTVLYVKGDRDAARTAARQSVAIMRRSEIAGHDIFFAAGLIRLAVIALDNGDPRAAEPLVREALAARLARYPGDHWMAAEARNVLARCLSEMGRHEEARPMLAESYAVLERVFSGSIPPHVSATAPFEKPAEAHPRSSRG